MAYGDWKVGLSYPPSFLNHQSGSSAKFLIFCFVFGKRQLAENLVCQISEIRGLLNGSKQGLNKSNNLQEIQMVIKRINPGVSK